MPRKPKCVTKLFKGDLVKPIKVPLALTPTLIENLSADEMQAIWEQSESNNFAYILKERTRKLSLLLSHYNIDPENKDKWFELSLYLSSERVEGFRVQYVPAQKSSKKWDDVAYAKLFFDIQNEKIKHESHNNYSRITIDYLCGFLAKTNTWSEFMTESKKPEKQLMNKYKLATKSQIVELYKNVSIALPNRTDLLNQIESMVNKIFAEKLTKIRNKSSQ